MGRLNCWEFMRCGREPGGAQSQTLGACTVPLDTRAEGLNGGHCAGRICWATSGTFSASVGRCRCTEVGLSCMNCDFFRRVAAEEGDALVLRRPRR